MPRRLRTVKGVEHHADAFAEQPVEAALLRLVREKMKSDRRLVLAELILGSELLPMVRRELIDVEPHSVEMLVPEETQLAGDGVAGADEIVCKRRTRRHEAEQDCKCGRAKHRLALQQRPLLDRSGERAFV
jgi:hypothetical protein